MDQKSIIFEFSILVVDDDSSIREIIAVILSRSGYHCESATNGVEAIQKVKRSGFDAVITDIEMPEMDGIALTRELSQHFSELPVIIMTGKPEYSCREMARQAGAKEFLSKPFALPDLIAKVHRVILGHNVAKDQQAPSSG